MVNIQIEYQGDLHCKATHGPSGVELSTDAPRDNQGRGESFSPTDLWWRQRLAPACSPSWALRPEP
jgi:hypothetical protein